MEGRQGSMKGLRWSRILQPSEIMTNLRFPLDYCYSGCCYPMFLAPFPSLFPRKGTSETATLIAHPALPLPLPPHTHRTTSSTGILHPAPPRRAPEPTGRLPMLSPLPPPPAPPEPDWTTARIVSLFPAHF
ncbi:hypothetical protein FIBSPDRAFT_1053280 [Athelia psychrophila]|uniref:Uncharacterized protein n=1 Tax=Athelia psychrophila TaxID=1759441 RepID=A0A167X6C9_9AGAM|nr:hypothetical protein FIBSPDRAFT_1053280 [Fibularhizoctonia sp. CBS 109695]